MILGKLVAQRKSTAWRRFLITSPMTTKKRVCHAILTHPAMKNRCCNPLPQASLQCHTGDGVETVVLLDVELSVNEALGSLGLVRIGLLEGSGLLYYFSHFS